MLRFTKVSCLKQPQDCLKATQNFSDITTEKTEKLLIIWLIDMNNHGLTQLNDLVRLPCRFPLKAVKVMHAVSLRTEVTLVGSPMPPNLGQAFKVAYHIPLYLF